MSDYNSEPVLSDASEDSWTLLDDSDHDIDLGVAVTENRNRASTPNAPRPSESSDSRIDGAAESGSAEIVSAESVPAESVPVESVPPVSGSAVDEIEPDHAPADQEAAPVEEHPRPNDGLNESYDSDGSIVILDDHELTFEAQSATNDEPIDFCSAEAEAGLPVSDADREVLQQLLSEQPEQQPQIDVRPWPIASRIKHSLCIEFGYLLLISSLLFLVGVLVHRDLQNGQLLKHMRQSVGHAQFMERSMHTRWEICDTQYTEAKSQIAELEKAPKCTTVPAEPAVQAEDEATSGHAIAYAQSRPDHVQNADNDRHRGRKVEGKAVWLGAGDEPEPAVKPPKAQIVEEQSWDLEECNDQKDPLCRLRRMINSDGDDVAAPMDHLSANGRKQDADHCDGDRFVRDFGAEVARKILDDSDCDEFSKLDSHFVSVGNFVMQQRQPRTHEQIHHNEELDQLEKMKRHIKHRDNKDGKRKKRDGHKKKADKAKKWQEEEESMDEKHRKYYDDANFIQRVQTIHRQLN